MKVKGISLEQLEIALQEVNKKYENNIIWNREPEMKGNFIHFTIKCRDSKKSGHRYHITYFFDEIKQKRGISACWHVHGDLFDIIWDIDPNVIIDTGALRMTSKQDNWQDRNIGSRMYPVMYSESCECKKFIKRGK